MTNTWQMIKKKNNKKSDKKEKKKLIKLEYKPQRVLKQCGDGTNF